LLGKGYWHKIINGTYKPQKRALVYKNRVTLAIQMPKKLRYMEKIIIKRRVKVKGE
jgi:hypothetical protein